MKNAGSKISHQNQTINHTKCGNTIQKKKKNVHRRGWKKKEKLLSTEIGVERTFCRSRIVFLVNFHITYMCWPFVPIQHTFTSTALILCTFPFLERHKRNSCTHIHKHTRNKSRTAEACIKW